MAIPFDNFITSMDINPNINEEHISFNTRNGNWLAEELNVNLNNPNFPEFDCSFLCNNAFIDISGVSTLCAGSYNFTIIGIEDGLFVDNWYIIDRNNLVTLTTSGNQATLTVNDTDKTGFVTLIANVGSHSCDGEIETIIKEIFVGKPSVQLLRVYEEERCDIKYHYVTFYARTYPENVNVAYDWFYPTQIPGAQYSTSSNEYLRIGFPKNRNQSFAVSVKATSACGEASSFWDGHIGYCDDINNDIAPNNTSGRPTSSEPQVYVAPNPISTGQNLSVQLWQDEEEIGFSGTNWVDVYDLSGNLQFSGSYSSSSFYITNISLNKGYYIINVTSSKGENYDGIIIGSHKKVGEYNLNFNLKQKVKN